MSVAIAYRPFGVMNHLKVVKFVMNVKKKKEKKGKEENETIGKKNRHGIAHTRVVCKA
jgi:hypothetical protein